MKWVFGGQLLKLFPFGVRRGNLASWMYILSTFLCITYLYILYCMFSFVLIRLPCKALARESFAVLDLGWGQHC